MGIGENDQPALNVQDTGHFKIRTGFSDFHQILCKLPELLVRKLFTVVLNINSQQISGWIKADLTDSVFDFICKPIIKRVFQNRL